MTKPKKVKKRKFSKMEKKLVIARLKQIPKDVIISIG